MPDITHQCKAMYRALKIVLNPMINIQARELATRPADELQLRVVDIIENNTPVSSDVLFLAIPMVQTSKDQDKQRKLDILNKMLELAMQQERYEVSPDAAG